MKKMIIKLLTAPIKDKEKRREIRHILLYKKTNKNNIYQNNNKDLYLLCAPLMNKQAFSAYKNIFAGRDVVIVGAGPTLNKYKMIKGAVHIGTNRTHLNKRLKLDFLFRQDFKNYDKELIGSSIKKFIGTYYEWTADMCPESVFNKLPNASKFMINTLSDYIPVNLDMEPLWHGGSVIYSAFQFALWTNPKRIYLVGCDCAGQKDSLHWHHYDDEDKAVHNLVPIDALLEGWQKLAKFAATIYPDVEIISVNPVGLKGLFKDIEL